MPGNRRGFTAQDFLRFFSALVAGIPLLLGAGLLIFSLLHKPTFVSGMCMVFLGSLLGLLSKYLSYTEWN